MNSIRWTNEQQAAITAAPGNLLVSAAAGAGKTAVLVERVIRRLLDKTAPVDIDQLLVVTFTEAAAREMRQRVETALTKILSDQPQNSRLQRQLALLNKADISTLHSFCLKIIRRYFYLLDLDPGFKIADETETALTQHDVLDQLWEDAYLAEVLTGGPFTNLLDCYGASRSDDNLKELVLKLYNLSRSQPWPEDWLRQLARQFQVVPGSSIDGLPWGKPLLEYVRAALEMALFDLNEALYYASLPGGPAKYLPSLAMETAFFKQWIDQNESFAWDDLKLVLDFSFERLVSIRQKDNVDQVFKSNCTDARNRAKKALNDLKKDIFGRPEAELVEETRRLAPMMAALVDVVIDFGGQYKNAKHAMARVDFADLEHYALSILRHPASKDGESYPSAAARQLEEEYMEVFVDEYQDINPVQDAILNLISRQDSLRPNLFEVGDVKQSIYGFRLAEPKLFLHKYLNYPEDDGAAQRRLTLTANFRSRPGVLAAVNFLFRQLLTDTVGGLTYDRAAQLNAGAKYVTPPAGTVAASDVVELHLIERQDQQDIPADQDLADQEAGVPGPNGMADLSALEKEALIIGRRIQRLIKGTAQQPGPEFEIWDKESKCYRPMMYKDIVILLRTMQGRATTVLEMLSQLEIPAYADLGTGYFSAAEIQVMMSLLRVIDNPRQDIALAAVLRSPIVGLSAAELAMIRLADPEGDYYEALTAASRQATVEGYQQKIEDFLSQLEKWRTLARRHSLGELIWQIYSDTNYMTYVAGLPAGVQRQANLRALYDRACQFENYGRPGLFRFLRFLERFQAQEGDLGTARALGENENVVRVMSIHKSKGLEFPVVFVADLGKQFNLRDLRGDILLHRDLGLGPTIVDLELNLKYPSLAHRAVNLSGMTDILAEELRIMYVAFTRAREKLILVGSVTNLSTKCRSWGQSCRHPSWELPPGLLLSARTYLDWLGPAVARHPNADALRSEGLPTENSDISMDPSLWKIYLHGAAELTAAAEAAATGLVTTKNAVDLSSSENDIVTKIKKALSWHYPHPEATSLTARVSVSELKGRLTLSSVGDQENDAGLSKEFESSAERPRFVSGQTGFTAVEHGSAMHLVLEQLDLQRPLTEKDIKEQIEQLVEREYIASEAAQIINVRSLASFFTGPIGKRLRAKPEAVRREVPFSLRLPAASIYPDRDLSLIEQKELILVQGIIDCLVKEKDGWLLLDFKTDRAARSVLASRLEGYRWQIQLYALAVSRFSLIPVSEAYIYFLSTGQAVAVEPPLLSRDFLSEANNV